MATAREDARRKGSSTSAPSTPLKRASSVERRIIDSSNRDLSKLHEKPMPNYLKPTISSSHESHCQYPKNQTSQVSIAMAKAGGKSLISIRSIDKTRSPPSHPTQKTSRITLESSIKTTTPSSRPRPSSSETASKAPPCGKDLPLTRARSLPQILPKRRVNSNGTPANTSNEPDEEDTAFVDILVSEDKEGNHSKVLEAEALPSQSPESKNPSRSNHHPGGADEAEEENTIYKKNGNQEPETGAKELSVDSGDEATTRKLKFRPGRVVGGNDTSKIGTGERQKFKECEEMAVLEEQGKKEAEGVVLKQQEVSEKELLPAYNDLIEETANKLGASNNKVKALAGAFETVISLQKPETLSSPTVRYGGVAETSQLEQEALTRGSQQEELNAGDSSQQNQQENKEAEVGQSSHSNQGVLKQ